MMKTVGILLAGGLSRRFGSPKAFAVTKDRFFYEWSYEALKGSCNHIVIVTRGELAAFFPADLDVMTDLPEVAGKGPLAGIYSGMRERPADRFLVLPCDMPFIGPNEVKSLISVAGKGQITAIQVGADRIPLFSLWNGGADEEIGAELLHGQRSVLAFMAKKNTHWIHSSRIHCDPSVFRNINSRED